MSENNTANTASIKWLDLHCHLNFLEISPEEAIANAKSVGVERMVTIGTCADDHQTVLDLVKKFFPVVHGTLGVHPHEAKDYNEATETFMREHLRDQGIVAVAEIGLDYYYDSSPREIQREVFRKQLALAEEFGLPVEIHTRDAEQDTIEILSEFKSKVRGVIHCFTGTRWLAEQALNLGWNISFSGVLTFKNAQDLRETCKIVPLERLHVETDAPFLAPVPHRGKKNQPAYVTDTASWVADLKGVSLEQLAEQTRRNALQMFPLLQW